MLFECRVPDRMVKKIRIVNNNACMLETGQILQQIENYREDQFNRR